MVGRRGRGLPISISAVVFLPLYPCCASRKVHLVTGYEVKNCRARLSVELGMPANASLSCGRRLCGRCRRRPWGADGESIVMDQRVSWLQPWVSECREQQQLYTASSLFFLIIAPPLTTRTTPAPPPLPPPSSASGALILLLHLKRSRFSLSLAAFLCGIFNTKRRLTLPVMMFGSICQRAICKFTKYCDWQQGTKNVSFSRHLFIATELS